MGGTNTTPLSQAQLVSLWENAAPAGSPAAAPGVAQNMAAIAQAESSSGANLVNPTSGASGIWQILPSAHPQYDVSALQNNPSYNAEAATQVFNAAAAAGSPLGGYAPWASDASTLAALGINGMSSSATSGGGGGATVTPGIAPSPLTNVLVGMFGEYGAWITGGTNVLYKAFVLIFALILVSVIPATQKFAGFAAFAVLFLLIIQDPGAVTTA